MRLALASFALLALATSADAAEWRVQKIDTPARVTAVETMDGQVRINSGGLWYRLALQDQSGTLSFFDDMPVGFDLRPDVVQKLIHISHGCLLKAVVLR